MADVDLNQPINWDDLEDFDGEARHLAGDFFFEIESDEEEDGDEDHGMRLDLGNGRGRGTLGLTGLRSATPWSSFMFPGESSSGGRGHGTMFVGESSSGGRGGAVAGRGAAGAGRGSLGRGAAAGRASRGRGATVGRVGRGRRGAAGAGRGAAGAGRGAPAGGHAGGDHPDGGDDGVPLGRFVNTRRVYSDEDKRKIYVALLRTTSMNVLNDGVTKAVAAEFMVPLRVVQRVWFDGIPGIENICNKKPLNCWRKRVDFDPETITQLPPSKRTTLKDLAYELGVSKTTLWRRFKEKMFRRHLNAIKPRISDENKKARVKYALSRLERDSISESISPFSRLERDSMSQNISPRFQGMYNTVHIDEKWFYKTKGSQNYYLGLEEEEPFRSCQSKHYIDKIMFLCVVARPRYDADGNCTFDGKIGMFPFVTEKAAERGSHNRLRGTMETKPLSVTRAVSRELLIEKVLPAIKEKWPLEDRWSPIFIQQDNAKTHVLPHDAEFVEAAAAGGWDIRLTCQPPNSPDTNILDLGLFAALQSLFQKKSPTSIVDILNKVQQAWTEYPAERSNRVFLTHQTCMMEIMRLKGEHRYKIPHMRKGVLQRLGILPEVLTCDPAIVTAAREFLLE